ncbi:MAG: Preprotein translocase SecG subunit [Armatimonadetes bacterium]|jgi:protein translocase SecG subunit|nr:Preprotein translocase SecG subunit [Armatimonadota bacterium]
MVVLKVLMYLSHFVVSVILIGLVVSQTSKSEGLGAVSGSSSPSLRGRAGVDEKLAEYTRYAAIAFMTLSAILYILATKFGWVA